MKCKVLNCGNTNQNKASSCSFFAFPSDEATLEKWIQFCRQDVPFNTKTNCICMLHFTDDDFENLLQFNMGFAKHRKLKRGAVPTVYTSNVIITPAKSKRQNKINADDLVELTYSDDGLSTFCDEGRSKHAFVASPISPTSRVIYNESSQKELDVLETNVKKLKRENETISTVHSVLYNDSSQEELDALETNVKKLKRENELLRNENEKQRMELVALKRASNLQLEKHAIEVKSLQKSLELMAEDVKNMEDKLGSIFTKGQIETLKAGFKSRNWTNKDIAQSITLYAASPKAYRLMYKQKFPLPPISTLKNWTQKLVVPRGILQPVFQLLEAATHMDKAQKLCVLSIGEMKVRPSCYDILLNTPQAPTNHVQVAMLRGLMSNWKQPIFSDFNCKITSDLLKSILKNSQNCGYNIVAVVSNLEGINGSLYNDFGITANKPWFLYNNQKIFVFPDVPFLLKTLRNHFVDHGFLINSKPVKKEIISKLLSCTSPELSKHHKISAKHLNIAEPSCQTVKTAAELFSHTVAEAIQKAACFGYLEEQNWNECFQLFQITNDWFDLMNVKVPQSKSKKPCYAYGLEIKEQNLILDEMTNLMKKISVIGKFGLLPFQKDIIQTNNALKMMFKDIQSRYNVKYILTYRLNQEVLEHFFELIRSKDLLQDFPDEQEFKYRLKLYLLGHNTGDVSEAGGVEDRTLDIEMKQPPLTGIMLKNLNSKSELWPVEEVEFEELGYMRQTLLRGNHDPLSVHF